MKVGTHLLRAPMPAEVDNDEERAARAVRAPRADNANAYIAPEAEAEAHTYSRQLGCRVRMRF